MKIINNFLIICEFVLIDVVSIVVFFKIVLFDFILQTFVIATKIQYIVHKLFVFVNDFY